MLQILANLIDNSVIKETPWRRYYPAEDDVDLEWLQVVY